MEILKCQPSFSKTSVIVCILLIVFFNLKKLLGDFKRIVVTDCRRYFYLVIQARASWRKAFPVFFSSHSPFSLDSSSFPLTGPRQETDQNWQADLPMRGASHSYTQTGMSREKLEAGWGIPRCACGDADPWGGMCLTHGLTAI